MNPATLEHIESSSPTVDIASVNTVIAIAAHKNYRVSTTDIKAAYLNVDLPDSMDVILVMDAISSATLVALRPKYRKYLRADGTMLA